MRVAIVGNLAGVAIEYVIGLRSLGIEADLFLTEAERCATIMDIASAEGSTLQPEWLQVIPSYEGAKARRGSARWLLAAKTFARELPVTRSLLSYDLIHSHTGSLLTGRILRMILVVLGIGKYIAVATGSDLREVAQEKGTWRGRWMRAFFRRASRVLLLNIDMLGLAERIGLKNATFFPFAINTDTFRPRSIHRDTLNAKTLFFFMMSRLDWSGDDPSRITSANENDRVFVAFARFLDNHPDSLLVVGDRGKDREGAKRIVTSYGIADRVRFVPPMSQEERINYMQVADVCLDQFGLGAYGLGTLESMACGKPLITYIEKNFTLQCGLDFPPILNARTIDEIEAAMQAAADPKLREVLGLAARDWIMRHHAREAVCRRLLDIYHASVRSLRIATEELR